ncbi:MAG: gamma-glutamyltransferase, partial [Planctomycetia bacterium]
MHGAIDSVGLKWSLVLAVVASTGSATVADEKSNDGRHAFGRTGMVVSVSRPASEAGLAAIRQGGDAVDAAVAVSFALAVTWPEAGNIGGGGFMVVHPGRSDAASAPTVFEYREKAPKAARADMFAAEVAAGRRLNPHLVVGVPGSPRGLELAHKAKGKLSWKSLVEPAVKLARDGFIVDEGLARSLNGGLAGAKRFP